LRFVKKTVNFDDPGTYHLYYGDSEGHPGIILTFFPWEHAAPGRAGVGLAQETAFRVPASSMGYWTHRFVEMSVTHEALEKRFAEPVLPFKDPDGLILALVDALGDNTEIVHREPENLGIRKRFPGADFALGFDQTPFGF
jgi:glyoxalase family protein